MNLRLDYCKSLSLIQCFVFRVQISSPLIKRVAQVDSGFVKDVEFEPRAAPEFEMQLDREPVLSAIQSMNFLEMKGRNYEIKEAIICENHINHKQISRLDTSNVSEVLPITKGVNC